MVRNRPLPLQLLFWTLLTAEPQAFFWVNLHPAANQATIRTFGIVKPHFPIYRPFAPLHPQFQNLTPPQVQNADFPPISFPPTIFPPTSFPPTSFPANQFPANNFPANQFPANQVSRQPFSANQVPANKNFPAKNQFSRHQFSANNDFPASSTNIDFPAKSTSFSAIQIPPRSSRKPVKEGICPLCERSEKDLIRHIRIKHEGGVAMSSEVAKSLGYTKCFECGTVLLPNGVKRHKNKYCRGPLISANFQEEPEENEQSHSELRSKDCEAGSHAPQDSSQPISDDTPRTPLGQPAHASDVPQWASDLGPHHVVACPVNRAVYWRLKNFFESAVERTSKLCVESQDPEAFRLLLLLPRVGGAKWAGKNWRKTSRMVLESYPFLTSALIKTVREGLKLPLNIREGHSDLSKTVKKCVKEGFLRKASRVLLGEGLARADETTMNKLKKLHPVPHTNHQAFSGPSPSADLRYLENDVMESVINRLPRDSAPGPSG